MTNSNASAIEIRGLRKRYGSISAIAGVDLAIGQGEVVALLGPNGAGKTTLLDIVLGLQHADEGLVRVLGRDVREVIRAGRLGAILQQGEPVLGVTIRELLTAMSAMQPHPMPLGEVIERAELADLLARRTDKLSGGETQRVRFALCLLGNPDLLVLDEPTAAMDITARRSFWAAIRDLAAHGRTIFFSTHYTEEADAIADRIVLLASGRVVADGPASEIRAVAAARVIRFTLPGASPGELVALLPQAAEIEIHGATVTLRAPDSDQVLRAVLTAWPDARDIEVSVPPLADAVLAITADPDRQLAATGTTS